MKNKVKILDFNRRDWSREQAEKELADLLDEGYTIAAATDSGGFASYTLVMRQIDMSFLDDGRIPDSVPAFTRWPTGEPPLPRGNTISQVNH